MLLDEGLSEAKVREIVNALRAEGEKELKVFREKAEKRRKRYYGDHYPSAGKAVQSSPTKDRVVLNREMRLVDKGYGLLTLDPPKISARPEEETEAGLVESDRLEAWLEGLLYLQRLNQGQDPISLGLYDALITSMGVLWVIWDTARDTRETGRLMEPPVVIKRRDPCKIILKEGGKKERWKYCMYVDELPVTDVEAEWPEAGRLKGYPTSYAERMRKTVEVVDFWGYEDGQVVNTVITPDQILKPPTVMEKYEYLPVVAWFCRETPSTQWEYKGLPITASMEATAPAVESHVNLLTRATKLLSQLPLLHKGQGDPPKLPAGYDNIVHIDVEEDLGFLQWPGHPPDMYRVLDILEQEVEASSLGAPLSTAGAGSASGYALALRGQAGTLQLVAPEQSYSLAMTLLLQKVCSLCASFAPDLEMRVFGKHENQRKVFALNGSQMQGWFIDVDISAQFPEDKDRKMAWGLQMAAMGDQAPLDSRTITEDFFGYANAERIRERKIADMARTHPGVQLIQLIEALRKRGLEYLIPIITGQMQGPPQPPGQGSPPNVAPNMPVAGVPTTAVPQEQAGAMRSQEMGMGPQTGLTPNELVQREMM